MNELILNFFQTPYQFVGIVLVIVTVSGVIGSRDV